jgi:hypothetical protein
VYRPFEPVLPPMKGVGVPDAARWCPERDLNPCYRLERAASWTRLDDRGLSAVGAGSRLLDGSFVALLVHL